MALSRALTRLLLVCTVLIFISIPFQARAVEYGGVGGRPANPRSDNPRTESIFVHTLNPGETKQDGVRVLNNTPDHKTLLVYAVDSAQSTGGAFACAQAADLKTDVGEWIELSKLEVSLDSLTNEVIPFTIKVPGNASVGEHNGCIVIQEKRETPNSEQSGIQLSFRTGLRVAILIPGNIHRELAIGTFSAEHKNGDFVLHPSVQNLGNVSVDTHVAVTTRYFFGKILQTSGGDFPILRNQVSEWNFTLPKPFWGGWFSSSLQVSYDKDPNAGVGVKSGTPLTVLNGSTIWIFSWPKPAALAIELGVLLIVLAILILLFARLRRNQKIRKEWVPYTVTVGENINSIADTVGVSWKLLAQVNDLKPPYIIPAGTRLRVPPRTDTE